MEKRTSSQNNAMHLWFSQVAELLNEQDLDVRTVLKEEIELWWTPNLVKEILWKQTEKILLGKESTTQLTTDEVNKIYEVLSRFLAKHEIHIPFPSHIEFGEPPYAYGEDN